jgi:hypothetical protein
VLGPYKIPVCHWAKALRRGGKIASQEQSAKFDNNQSSRLR